MTPFRLRLLLTDRMMMTNLRQTNRRLGWLVLLLVVIAALALVAAPVWIIQPFKPQTNSGLAVSYALRRWSPLLTVTALVISLALVLWLWRGSQRWIAKIVLVILLLPAIAAAWFARQNHFEWMFNPLANSAYAKANDASFVGEEDMVLAVEHNGDAVAYPVRLMAYHHVVRDTVGGTPIVATY
jgi:Protein of unknown function (DUF3179)